MCWEQAAEAYVPMKGTIEHLEGAAKLQKKGETRWVVPLLDMKIEEGDRIATGGDSLVEIRLEDGSQIRITAGSLVEIGEREKRINGLKLWWGKVRARIDKRKIRDSSAPFKKAKKQLTV